MSAAIRRLVPALFLVVLDFAMTGGFHPVSETPLPPLPDLGYVYGPGDVIPEDARMVSPEEFSRLWQSGGIILSGAKSDMEAEAREQTQDEEDRRTIEQYLAGLGMDTLPDRPLDTSGDTSLQGDGSVRTRFLIEGTNELREVITMGDRFRLRAVARSIRQFGERRNQAEIYEQFYTELDDSWRRQLKLPRPEDTSDYSWSELRDLNNEIARNWGQIIGTLDFPFEPVLPPACSDEEGSGNRTDGNGNRSSCGYHANGVMMNYNWPGKQHISCVKDQANRGTCPAFSTISTMEYHIHRQYDGRRVNLSEQALYARMKFTWGNGQHFGDGYWPNDGFNQSFGERYLVPWEEQWNYNPSMSRFTGTATYASSCDGYDETCSNTTHQTGRVCTTIPFAGTFCGLAFPDVNPQDWGFRVAGGTTNYYDPADRELSLGLMILAVVFRAQVVWSFDVTRSSFTPNAAGYVSYVSANDPARGAHAVHVVGMISNERLARTIQDAPAGSGGGYFIIKNSWSNCWGDGGFAYIPFDSVLNYTLEMVSAPSVM